MNRLLCSCIVASALFLSAQSHAEPTVFEYQKVSGGVSAKKMKAIYDLIPNPTGNSKKARLAILKGMQQTKGVAWLVEGEGDGYVLARWDYKGHAIIHRIEYNDDAVQIKFAGGVNDYQCAIQKGDFCYKTHRNYYKYNRSLVKELKRALGNV